MTFRTRLLGDTGGSKKPSQGGRSHAVGLYTCSLTRNHSAPNPPARDCLRVRCKPYPAPAGRLTTFRFASVAYGVPQQPWLGSRTVPGGRDGLCHPAMSQLRTSALVHGGKRLAPASDDREIDQRGAPLSVLFCERERLAFHSTNAFLALLPKLSLGKWALALPASLRYQCLRVLIEAPRRLIPSQAWRICWDSRPCNCASPCHGSSHRRGFAFLAGPKAMAGFVFWA